MTGGLGEHLNGEIDAPGAAAAEHGAARATVDVVDADRLGVVVERLRVDAGPGDIAGRARRLAEGLRPAGERLRAVEVAPELGGATLRSDPEDMHGGRFFQVDVDGEGAEITRHRAVRGEPRVREAFGLTREQLGRVVDDLARGLED